MDYYEFDIEGAIIRVLAHNLPQAKECAVDFWKQETGKTRLPTIVERIVKPRVVSARFG